MKPEQKITEILASHRGERHLIVLHEYPDPDAIASGYAHRIISGAFEIEADILYSGKISHPQNIALTRALDCNLIPFVEDLDFRSYDAAVFVDHQGTTVGEILCTSKTTQLRVSDTCGPKTETPFLKRLTFC